MTVDARKTAFDILNIVDKQKKTLDIALEDVFYAPAVLPLSQKDVNLAHSLIYGVIRWRASLDYRIGLVSKTPIAKLDSRVLNALRLGVFQLVYLDRIPDYAAIHSSVDLVKPFSPPWIVRYVNAVLRNIDRQKEGFSFPEIDANPVEGLSVRQSMPKWLLKRWLNRFGSDRTIRICEAVNSIPPLTIRVNRMKTDRERLIRELVENVEYIEKTIYSPDGLKLFGLKRPLRDMDAFREGQFQVQDEAAQLVAYLLTPMPGETILDACAGIGGKTAHIAQIMKNQGKIVCGDVDKKKLARLNEEMIKTHITIAHPCVFDMDRYPKDDLAPAGVELYDRILVDAPCSGLGVIRRNPDAKWSVFKKDLMRFQKRQLGFIDRVSAWVKPGGVIVYAVCSIEPEETDDVIGDFLQRHPEFELDRIGGDLKGKRFDSIYSEGILKTHYGDDDMDAFYAARLVYRKQ